MKNFIEIMNAKQSIYQSCIELKEYFNLDIDIEKYEDIMSREHEDFNIADIVVGKYVLEEIVGLPKYNSNTEMIKVLECHSKEIMECMKCKDNIKKLFNAINNIVNSGCIDMEYRVSYLVRNYLEYCIETGTENYSK